MPESRRLNILPRWLTTFAGLTLLSLGLLWADESPSTPPRTVSQADKTKRDAVLQALQPIGTLVGEWKGVSQPKRCSNAGAWPEKAAATWKFEDSTSLVLTFESDKLYLTAVFGLADDGKSTQLTLSKLNGDPIVLSRTAAEEDSKDKFVAGRLCRPTISHRFAPPSATSVTFAAHCCSKSEPVKSRHGEESPKSA